MDIEDFPLSDDDRQQIDDALLKLDIYVLEQRQLVSYQWLSNELAIDALIARRALSAFIEQHKDELDVLWLLSGRTTAVNKYGVPSQLEAEKSDRSTAASGESVNNESGNVLTIEEDDTGDVVKVNEITLVRDADLEEVKQQFESITSLHPYSIAAKPPAESQPIKDLTAALYSLQMQQLLTMYDQPMSEANALRDGRYSVITPDPEIKRNLNRQNAALVRADSGSDQQNGHTSSSSKPSALPPSSAAASASPTAVTANGGFGDTIKKAGKSNALANMFSKQTTALKNTPLPPAAKATEPVEEDKPVQSNAATVLPAEEEKMGEDEEEQAPAMDTEDAEAVDEDEKPASKAKHKPSSSSRKSKASKKTPASKKKRKRTQSTRDEVPYPNPYDSHSDEEKDAEVEEEEEEERYRAAAAVEEQQVPDSMPQEEEREDERMDGTEAGSKFKQFFTAQPNSQSSSAAVPTQKKKVQKTYLDDDGYMVMEEVEEEDVEAEQQRVDREKEEEKVRLDKDSQRKQQKEKERKEKEKADEEERERKEKEKKDKREQKKQEKKKAADQAKEADDETASQSSRRSRSKKPTESAEEDEVMDEEEEQQTGKRAVGSKKGKKKGKEEVSNSPKESPKEKAPISRTDSDKGSKKEKGGKSAAEKPKNNASILSFFGKR